MWYNELKAMPFKAIAKLKWDTMLSFHLWSIQAYAKIHWDDTTPNDVIKASAHTPYMLFNTLSGVLKYVRD